MYWIIVLYRSNLMIVLQSGMSRPSSATEVANMQFSSPFLNLAIVETWSRNEVLLSPESPWLTPTWDGLVRVCDFPMSKNYQLTRIPTSIPGMAMAGCRNRSASIMAVHLC